MKVTKSSWAIGTKSDAHVPVAELRDINRVFRFGMHRVHAVRDVSLTLSAAEMTAIIGPSGSGKSTLLSLLGLLDRPTSGTYRLNGFVVDTLSPRARTALRGTAIGFVFQSFHLLPYRSALTNVMLSTLYNRVPRKERRRRALDAINRVSLTHRKSFYPSQLSGGESQRVAIARALAGHPSILLCDEPTGNLDANTSDGILDLLATLCHDGLTIVIVTHDPRVSARADRILRMEDGFLSEEA